MAKEKIPSTPETRAKKLEDKKEVSKAFSKTFFAALAVCLSVLLIYSVCYISFFRPKEQTIEGGSSAPASSNTVINNGGSSSTNNGGSSSTDNGGSAAPADNGGSSSAPADNGGSAAPADNGGASSGELSASSSVDDVVAYFNTAINKVKPNASSITLVKEENTEAGGIEGNLPGALTSIANSLISNNMGVKAENQPSNANDFPVENESWSSHLTADDVERHEVVDNGSTYTITLYIKADDPSESSGHDYGHNGKVFSVISPSIVTDNAGPASSMIKEVKTGHRDGYVKVVVDKATGNVTSATYYFVWTLSLKALGASLSIPFGLQKDYSITY